MAGKKFAAEFALRRNVSALDKILIQDSDDDVVKYAYPPQIAALSGYAYAKSIADLPLMPTNKSIGYIVGQMLYIYVGMGGDTKDGLYQSVGFFVGPQGVQGEKGEQGERGEQGIQGPKGDNGGLSLQEIDKYLDTKPYVTSDTLADMLAGYVSNTSLMRDYVTIANTQEVTGVKNFTAGVQFGGLSMYKSKDDTVYLDANLVVRGAVTMYGLNTTTSPSIFSALPIDGTTIGRNERGELYVIGGGGSGGGGVADSIAWSNVTNKPTWITDTKPKYSYSEILDTPDLSVKADKATTLAGYGITNAYTKSEVNNIIDSLDDTYVTIVDGTADLGSIAIDGTATATFIVQIANDAPLNHNLSFDVDVKYEIAGPGGVQDLTYAFDNDLNGWTIIDANRDNHSWYHSSVALSEHMLSGDNNHSNANISDIYSPSAGGHIISESFCNNTAAGMTPDDFIVSPMQVRPTESTKFEFYVRSKASSYKAAAEHFGVFVSTAENATASDFETQNGWEWTLTETNVTRAAKAAQRGYNGVVTVGEGGTGSSNVYPYISTYAYSTSQQIYKAAEIGQSGTISKIAFHLYNEGVNGTVNDVKIYIKHTTKDAFASRTDWDKEVDHLIILFRNVMPLIDEFDNLDFGTLFTNIQTPAVKENIANVVNAIGSSEIFGDSIYSIIETVVKEITSILSYTC